MTSQAEIVANLKTRVNALSERARGLSERAEVGKHRRRTLLLFVQRPWA